MRRLSQVVLLGLLAASGSAEAAEHEVYAFVAGDVWPVPEGGGHGILFAQWRVRGEAGALRLTLNTDTLDVSYDAPCWGRVCAGAQVRGQALFGGLLSDYYAGGLLDSTRAFQASSVLGSGWVQARLPDDWYARYQVGVRKWLFGRAGDTAAALVLPPNTEVVEQALALTYWGFAPDRSQWEPHRTLMRYTGLGLGVRFLLDARVDDRAWGLNDPRNAPDRFIPRIRQWSRYGASLTDGLRVQVSQHFGWGSGEDDLTRDRLGGLNPYVVPLGGVPWAAFLAGRYVAGRLSLHGRVWADGPSDLEVGAFVDGLAARDLERVGSRRFGGALGAGGFVDARLGAWQADLHVGYAPGLGWGAEDHYLSAYLAVGYRVL